MKQGDKVMIYSKPLTREEPEGEAILVKQLEGYDGNQPLRRWKVKFTGEGEPEVYRFILPEVGQSIEEFVIDNLFKEKSTNGSMTKEVFTQTVLEFLEELEKSRCTPTSELIKTLSLRSPSKDSNATVMDRIWDAIEMKND